MQRIQKINVISLSNYFVHSCRGKNLGFNHSKNQNFIDEHQRNTNQVRSFTTKKEINQNVQTIDSNDKIYRKF